MEQIAVAAAQEHLPYLTACVRSTLKRREIALDRGL